MATLNKILSAIVMILAIVSVVFSFQLYQKRSVMSKRGDVLAKNIEDVAVSVDFADGFKNANESLLSWKAFDASADGTKPAGVPDPSAKQKLDDLVTKVKDTYQVMDKGLDTITRVAEVTEYPDFPVKEELKAPEKFNQVATEMDTFNTDYSSREDFLRSKLALSANKLDPNYVNTAESLKIVKNYTEAQDIVDTGIANLKERNVALSNAISDMVNELGNDEYLGVDKDQIREVRTEDVTSVLTGITKIMGIVDEAQELRQQNNLLSENIDDLKKQLADARKEVADWAAQKAEGDAKLAECQDLVIQLEEKNRQSEIASNGDGTNRTSEGIEFRGKVLSVNYDYNFVVLDIGTDKKMSFGVTLSVSRDREYIGDVRVTKIFKKYCVAEILPDTQQGMVIEGDSVTSF